MTIKNFSNKNGIFLGANNNALVILFAINAFVFITLAFLRVAFIVSYNTTAQGEAIFNQQIFTWFVVPTSFNAFLAKVWTIVSYMFSTYNAILFASTMLWFWLFGYVLQSNVGNNHLMPIYLYGGFIGAVCFLVTNYFLPNGFAGMQVLQGASVAVMAIIVATTTAQPNYKFFSFIQGGISLWVITVVYILLAFATIGIENIASTIAHIASAIMGYIYIKLLQKQKNMGAWMNNFVAWVNNLFNPQASTTNFYKADKPPFTKTSNFTEQKLNTVLDKINASGMQSLTQDEIDFLHKSKEEL